MTYLNLDVIACLPTTTDFMQLSRSGCRVKGSGGMNEQSNDIWTHFNGVGQGKAKANPLQAWTGPEGSRSLRLPDFKTIGT